MPPVPPPRGPCACHRVTQGGPALGRSEELKSTVLAVLALWPAAETGGCHLAGSGRTVCAALGAVLFGHSWVRESFCCRLGLADSLFRYPGVRGFGGRFPGACARVPLCSSARRPFARLSALFCWPATGGVALQSHHLWWSWSPGAALCRPWGHSRVVLVGVWPLGGACAVHGLLRHPPWWAFHVSRSESINNKSFESTIE